MNFTKFKKCSNKLFFVLRFIFTIAAAILISYTKGNKKNKNKKQTEEDEGIEFFNNNKKRPML